MQITNNMYEGLIDQDSFISSPSLASTAAACINSGYCSTRASTGSDLLYYLSVLKEKVQQLQALVATAISNHTHHHQNHEKEHPAAAAVTSAASLIHEIIFAASSMAYAFQQLSSVSPPGHLQCKSTEIDHHQQNHYMKAAPSYAINHDHHDASQLATTDNNTCIHQHQLSTFGRNSSEAAAAAAGGGQYYNFAAAASSVNETQCQYNTINTTDAATAKKISDATTTSSGAMAAMELVGNINDTDKEDDDHVIIELEAADLLAKYTHFCQVCGKGFRRDANLRMHMRAHGDEYKTNEALTNPMKKQKLMTKNNKSSTSTSTNDELMLEEDPHEEEFAAASTAAAAGLVVPQNRNRNQKYSCPHEGCRWNKKHAKFQPLKSMVCVKNHYKRSHCPKMYVCNRCNRKQFSVLSDLRTHEKHCGDNLRWRCSCGTTFSRKDKLMGHVALFVGHAPAIAPHHNNTPHN